MLILNKTEKKYSVILYKIAMKSKKMPSFLPEDVYNEFV